MSPGASDETIGRMLVNYHNRIQSATLKTADVWIMKQTAKNEEVLLILHQIY